jgi:hypothetical protein
MPASPMAGGLGDAGRRERKWRTMDRVGFGCYCLVGLVFAVSAASKLRGSAAFWDFVKTARTLTTAVIPGYRTGRDAARRIGVLVIAGELAVPVLLVVPGTAGIGLGVAIVLLTVFGVGIAAATRRGLRTSCRCFGSSSTPLGRRHLVRNALLVAAAATGLAFGPERVGQADPSALAVAGAAAVILAVLVVRLDDLTDLFTPASAVADRPSR